MKLLFTFAMAVGILVAAPYAGAAEMPKELKRGPAELLALELVDVGEVVVAHEVGVRHQQLRAQSCLALAQPAALGADLGQLIDRMSVIHGVVPGVGLACA
jgi:hypothetical protein